MAPLACLLMAAPACAASPEPVVLRSPEGVEAVFSAEDGRCRWSAYRDPAAGREWRIGGPLFSLQTPDGSRANLGEVGCILAEGAPPTAAEVTLQALLARPAVEVRQAFAFCEDGRTLRVRTRLRALAEPVLIQRVGLLEIELPGQALERIGPGHVSCPIIGDRVFAGVEHPSALSQISEQTLYIAQHSYTLVGADWTDVPPAVFGSAAVEDGEPDREAVRRAFLRYLDMVRVKPRDMHVHYNNWWTMPVPFSEQDVLDNIAALKAGLYDRTGFFFDSYAMDMGWSDPRSVWDVNRAHYPEGFRRIRDALAEVGCRPGLWVSPSSLYPPALDNAWLAEAGYEVAPGSHVGTFACLALGGRYQRTFRRAVLGHGRAGNLGHVKFDGLAWPCSATTHGHRPGFESYQPIAEGLMDVLDALRAQNPDIALEPTCLGYYPSPWWLMHTPYVIGPFGDDSPRGRGPCPEWIESMTTGRDIANLRGGDAFWMPSSALECFDIIVQCPGEFRNHAVMAVARGHWFQSTYINPRFMDAGEWGFFAELIRWARAHREQLQNPVVFGGDPTLRQAYGYAYPAEARSLYFARNPWIEEAEVALPEGPDLPARELRTLYPCREVLGGAEAGGALPAVTLGPYESVVLEVVPTVRGRGRPPMSPPPGATWRATEGPILERLVFRDERPAYGPSWTSPDGDADSALVVSGSGRLNTPTAAELCLLVEGPPDGPLATCSATLDDAPADPRESGSRGAFAATGAPPEEEWQWFLIDVPAGRHELTYRLSVPGPTAKFGAYVRGVEKGSGRTRPFDDGPAFPLGRPAHRSWSRTLMPLVDTETAAIAERSTARRTVEIDGVFLDALDWREATAGWGEVRRNVSVMGKPMTMAGRVYRRGLGTHAHSRIVYELPAGHARFAATIGADQEVGVRSIIFVVEADGHELYRSPLMGRESPPVELDLPVRGVRELALIVEDGGDGIAADHGNWAEARLLR
ncbi:MAG: hypothetical protein FJX74_02460 [Armatimonadetes bacterium]|nr:hypothetical protein [Armatimonadota bacterium]